MAVMMALSTVGETAGLLVVAMAVERVDLSEHVMAVQKVVGKVVGWAGKKVFSKADEKVA